MRDEATPLEALFLEALVLFTKAALFELLEPLLRAEADFFEALLLEALPFAEAAFLEALFLEAAALFPAVRRPAFPPLRDLDAAFLGDFAMAIPQFVHAGQDRATLR